MVKESLVKANDQMFGNEFCTRIVHKGCVEEVFMGYRPKIAHGVFGIVEDDGFYHLMREDDGSYWTHAILDKSELKELKERIEYVMQFIIEKPNWKFSYRKGFVKDYKHNKFPIKIDDESTGQPIIKLGIKKICTDCKKDEDCWMTFHFTWGKELVRCLNLEETESGKLR